MASQNVANDRLAVIRITGMHSFRCEKAIEKALLVFPGVHEVEVDFLSAQASVLYDGQEVNVSQLMSAVSGAGYSPIGCTQR